MTQEQALALIDTHKNRLVDPVEMLDWTWLRVIIDKLDETAWANALDESVKVVSQ